MKQIRIENRLFPEPVTCKICKEVKASGGFVVGVADPNYIDDIDPIMSEIYGFACSDLCAEILIVQKK